MSNAMTFKEFKKLLRTIKFPGGEGRRIYDDTLGRHEATWTKHGGYADKVLERFRTALAAARFKPGDGKTDASPDGNSVWHGTFFHRGPVVVRIESAYGVTRYDNHFSINVEVKAADQKG